jgi:hypothetical protein
MAMPISNISLKNISGANSNTNTFYACRIRENYPYEIEAFKKRAM